jgi:hypothetical protein
MGQESSPSSAVDHDDPVRTAIHAERRTRRFQLKRRHEKDARVELRSSLNSAPNIRHLLEFAGLLCRIGREMTAAGVEGDLPENTAAQRVGRELLALARLGDVRAVARLAHRRMFEFYEPLEEEYHQVAPPHMVARWRRGGIRSAYKLVRKYLEEPDIPHNRANWQHVAGLHYLRVEFWYDLGTLAGFEEEDGVLLDPHEPLSADDPGLPFPALCAMTADDLREFLTKRLREFIGRVPLRVRRNIDRIRLGSAGNAIINQTPCDLAKSSNEVCLRLIQELERMARITGWDASPPRATVAVTPPAASVGRRGAHPGRFPHPGPRGGRHAPRRVPGERRHAGPPP